MKWQFLAKAGGALSISLVLAWFAVGCVETQVSPDEECSGAGGGGAFVPRGASWTPPLKQSLALFRRPREASDELPRSDCGVIGALDLASDADLPNSPGKVLVGESRRVLTGLPEGRNVFVVPTSTGGLCGIVTGPGANYACGAGSDQPGPGYWDPTHGDPYVWGVVPNEIVAINVTVDGRDSRVRVRENAFYFQFRSEIPSDGFDFDLVAVYKDGARQKIK